MSRILRAADIFLKTGLHKHAIQQTFFLYVYEPGQPRRSRQRRRAAHPGARLEADRLNLGRTQEGPGLGPEDDQSFHSHETPPV
jgi:catechol 2,3-dioxygenase